MSKFARGVILAAIAAVTLLVVAVASRPAEKDFIAYWSAGHQLVEHRNPYARDDVYVLERREGLHAPKPLVMRNPPWTLFIVYPLGFLSPRLGLMLWMAAALGAVALCLRVFEVPARDRLLAFCFAPVYASIAVGQSSPLLLLGFSLFVTLHRRNPFLAGASLLFMMAKPHLFLVFLPIVLIDSLYRRSYRILAGAGAAIAFASLIASSLTSHIWTDYLKMLRTSGIESDFIPSAVGSLGVLAFPHYPMLQLIPSALAVPWAIQFYWKKRQQWSWRTDSLPLLLVSVLVSPYAWMTDEIVLLPAVLFTISSPYRARYTFAVFMVLNTVALTMLMEQAQLPSGLYAWTSTAWVALFLYNRSGRIKSFSVSEEVRVLEVARAA